MTTFIADTFHLLVRDVRATIRIPIWVIITLVQPIIWLVLYGQLFKRVIEIPGFAATSYVEFLTPGVVIMSAMFGSAWAGMGIIQDLDAGVMDRMLATSVHRGSLIAAHVLHSALTVIVQTVIILGIALVLGARFPGGVAGVLMILLISALLGAAFSALSNGIALMTRREETLVAVTNFFGLPLTFLSSAFMASALMPGWISSVARANPVNWAVESSRNAMLGQHWLSVGLQTGLLVVFVLICGIFATRAFRVYQQTN